MFNAVKLCQVQYYSLLEAFIKATKASVTFHGEGNVLLIAFQSGLLFVSEFSNRTVGCPRSRGRSTQSCYHSTICLMWHVGFRRLKRNLFQGHIKTIRLFARQNRKLTIDVRLFGRFIILSHRELGGKH